MKLTKRRSDEFMRQEADGWYSRHVSLLVTLPYIENVKQFAVPERGKLSDGREGVAAETLLMCDRHAGKIYPLGYDAATMQDIAEILTDAVGKLFRLEAR